MAARTIAVKITLDNRDALNATKAQILLSRELAEETEKQTQLQNGLTNSFLKGNLAARAISEGFLALKNSIGFVVGNLAELGYTLARVRSATGASAGTADSLKQSIFKLGRETSSSVEEISKASLELAKLGFSGRDLEIVLVGVSRLSASLGDSLESTGQLVGGVVNTFDLSSKQAATVADKLFVATGKSAASIDSFRTAFGLAGNVAANAGVSFEDLAAAIATLSNQGIKASTVGTGLRTFITNLGIEGSKAQQILGGSVQELGLLGAMERMATLKPDTGTIFDMFGKPGSAVASAMENSTGMFKEFQKAIENSNGQLQAGGTIINDTLLGSITRLKNGILELGNTFTDLFSLKEGGLNFFGKMAEQLGFLNDRIAENRRFEAYLENKTKDAGGNKVKGYERAAADLGAGDIYKMPAPMVEANLRDAFLKREAENKVKFGAALLIANKAKEKENLYPDLHNISKGNQQEEAAQAEALKASIAKHNKTLADKEAQKVAAKAVKEKQREQAEKDKEEARRSFVRLPNEDLYSMQDQRVGSQNQDTEIMPWLSKPKTPLDKKDKSNVELFSKDKTDELEKFQQKLNETVDSFSLLGDSAFAALNKAQASFVAMQASVQGVNGSVDILSSYFIEGIFSEKKDPFKHISDAFGDFAKKMAADLVALSLKILFFRGLLAVLSLSTGGAGAALTPFVTQLATATTGTKFASGTDQVVTKPTMFMAGESGKERVTVTPRAKMSSGGSGGGITVNIQGDVLDGAKFAEAVETAQKRLRGRTV